MKISITREAHTDDTIAHDSWAWATFVAVFLYVNRQQVGTTSWTGRSWTGHASGPRLGPIH